jgi:predicted O-methyltransferase YrrM
MKWGTYRDKEYHMNRGTVLEVTSIIYNEYIDKILRSCRKEVIKPFMRCREAKIIVEVLRNLQPMKCLEWGSGFSTIYFPKFLNKDAKLLSIEHDEGWSSRINAMNNNSNVQLFLVPPNHFPWTDEHEDGTYSDLKDYVEFPSKFGNFDFVLVDGRARKDCMIKAYQLITDDAVVILHDSNRQYYHEAFELYKHQVIFKDYQKDCYGLWIGSKGIDIRSVLDVDKHRKVWDFASRFGSRLRI